VGSAPSAAWEMGPAAIKGNGLMPAASDRAIAARDETSVHARVLWRGRPSEPPSSGNAPPHPKTIEPGIKPMVKPLSRRVKPAKPVGLKK